MKKKKLAIVLSSIAVIALIGGTYAAFATSTATQHKVSTQNLKIALHQEDGGAETVSTNDSSKAEASGKVRYTGMPGDEVEQKLWIENTGTEDCFVRVTINRSWMDNGEKVFKDEVDPQQIKILSGNGWYVAEDPDGDPEILYCYYKDALTKGQTTTEVMKAFSILKENMAQNSNVYAGLSANLDFEVDAIQSYAAEKAMLAEWGVEADIQNGQITSMPQFQ